VTDAEAVLHRLDASCRLRGFDWGARADTAMDCAWSAEVRVTPQPNHPGRPDRSVVTYSAGGATADGAVRRAALEMLGWLETDAVATLGLTGHPGPAARAGSPAGGVRQPRRLRTLHPPPPQDDDGERPG